MAAMNPRDVMLVVSDCVNNAIEQAFEIFEPRKDSLYFFLKEIITSTQLRHLTTTDGLEVVRDMLANADKRDYLITLDGLIHGYIADRYILYKALLENLTNVLSVQGFAVDVANNSADSNLFPAEYIARIPSFKETQKLLENNKILVTILCLCMWGKVPYEIVVSGQRQTLVPKQRSRNVEVAPK